MPSADQVPVKNPHSIAMRWHKWVVLIAGSTGSALRVVRPPNFTSRRLTGAISFTRKRDGLLVPLALGHHGPGHPRDLVGKCDGGNLGRPSRQQRREPGPMPGAMDLGVADDGERSGYEQAA